VSTHPESPTYGLSVGGPANREAVKASVLEMNRKFEKTVPSRASPWEIKYAIGDSVKTCKIEVQE
jgi:hypothetical protein